MEPSEGIMGLNIARKFTTSKVCRPKLRKLSCTSFSICSAEKAGSQEASSPRFAPIFVTMVRSSR